MPYSTLSYANGPGYKYPLNGTRADLSKEPMGKLNY